MVEFRIGMRNRGGVSPAENVVERERERKKKEHEVCLSIRESVCGGEFSVSSYLFPCKKLNEEI